MLRFINEDHAAMCNELDAEMAKLGLVDDGSGNFVQAPRSLTQAPVFNPPSPSEQALERAQLTQVPPIFAQPTPPAQPQNHNWDKREADARTAQRELSLERERILEERTMLSRERAEAMATLTQLQEQRTALQTQASQVPVVQQQILSPAFREEYPDIAQAIEQAFAANQQEITSLRQERQHDVDANAVETEKNRRKLFLDEVRRSHSDYDAIIASDVFAQWMNTQNRSTQLVLEETFNLSLGYAPSDLVEVFSRFKRALNPAHVAQQVPQGLNSVDPGNRSMDSSTEPSGPTDFVFSRQEMMDPQLIDRWMQHSDHRKNRKAAMDAFDAAWERSVAFHNRTR